jgi:hypothetical protein
VVVEVVLNGDIELDADVGIGYRVEDFASVPSGSDEASQS